MAMSGDTSGSFDSLRAKLQELVIGGIEDDIAAVREAAVSVLPKVAPASGEEWVAQMIQKLTALLHAPSRPTAVSPGSQSAYLLKVTVGENCVAYVP